MPLSSLYYLDVYVMMADNLLVLYKILLVKIEKISTAEHPRKQKKISTGLEYSTVLLFPCVHLA